MVKLNNRLILNIIFIGFCITTTNWASSNPIHLSSSQELEVFYSYRGLNQNIDPYQSASDLILFANSNFIAELDQFRFEARPEVRLIGGTNNQLSTDNPNFLHLESPTRSVETRFHFGAPNSSMILYGDWERLNLSYTNDKIELSIGRKPFSLGVTKYLPVWNKFSRPLPGLNIIPIYFGADGAIAKLKLGEWVAEISQHFYNFGKDQISTGQLIYYGELANIHLMLGNWWNQPVWGIALAKDAFEGSFTSEFLGYGSSFQWGNGYERAINDRISIGIETLYQSDGATNSLNYSPFLHSHFQVFQASFYSYEVLSYQWSSLLKFNFGGLTNWIDLGTAMNLGALYSINDHLDLGIDSLIPAFRTNAEFSNRAFQLSDGSAFGIPFQIVTHLDWNF